jgi:hypothetical protein
MENNWTSFMKYFCVLVMVFYGKILLAQKLQSKAEIISSIIEKLVENTESTIDYTDLQAQLEYLYDNKINLNKTTDNELRQLIFLKQTDILSILKHQKLYGNFESIYELQAIDNISDESIYLLKHFVTVNETNKQLKISELNQIGKTEIVLQHENDFQQRLGYQTNELKAQNKQYYLGSPYRYVVRAKQKLGKNIDLGFTAEKDAGEQFFEGAQSNGFDFYSAHLHVKNVWRFSQIIIGDYQANFGQGLTFGSGLSARKSAYVLNINRYFQNIRPYRSVNEFEFMRGAALNYQHKNWTIIGFISSKKINTNFQTADTNQINPFDGFTGFNATGLHRTNNEIADKENVQQTILGMHIQHDFKFLQLGFTGIQTNYSSPFLPGKYLYQKFNFTGTQLINAGLDYKLALGNALLSGEFSSSSNGAFATTHSLLIALDNKLDICLLYRNFDKDYQVTYNNPFAENSDGRNETGFYFGISYKPKKALVFNHYIDFYQSKWLRYLVDAPSKGYDVLNEVQYNPSKSLNMYVRYRIENKEKNELNNNEALNDALAMQQKQQFRFHIKYKLNLLLEAETRLEQSYFTTKNITPSNGTLIYQDLKYKANSGKWTVSARLALFSIDDYNARIYAYEDNLPYTFTVPLYQNSGSRFYLMAKYQINKKIKLFARYAQTKYSNINSIGTGLERINGNTQSDLSLQLQVSF